MHKTTKTQRKLMNFHKCSRIASRSMLLTQSDQLQKMPIWAWQTRKKTPHRKMLFFFNITQDASLNINLWCMFRHFQKIYCCLKISDFEDARHTGKRQKRNGFGCETMENIECLKGNCEYIPPERITKEIYCLFCKEPKTYKQIIEGMCKECQIKYGIEKPKEVKQK